MKRIDVVSKSKFKPRALEYFREVEKTGRPLVITDHGKPVLRIIPFASDPQDILKELRGSILKFTDPTKPVGVADWKALK